MKLGISANPNKPAAVRLAQRAVEVVRGRADLVGSDEIKGSLGPGIPTQPLEQLEADVLLVLGGDGTFLSHLRRTAVPLLPVHAGTVGFLAEIDGKHLDQFDDAIERVLAGRYVLEDRMKLASEAGTAHLPDATNEVVVHTSQVAKMRLFEIAIDGQPTGTLRADGIILATPTGSTSYALSALGPIVDPSLEGIVVVALAPFQSTQRAVVVEPLRTLSVRLVLPEKEGVVVVDGQTEARLAGGEAVVAYRSPRKATFVRFGSQFFRRLKGSRILPWNDADVDPEGPGGADLPPPT